jgi:hypothetical protein
MIAKLAASALAALAFVHAAIAAEPVYMLCDGMFAGKHKQIRVTIKLDEKAIFIESYHKMRFAEDDINAEISFDTRSIEEELNKILVGNSSITASAYPEDDLICLPAK